MNDYIKQEDAIKAMTDSMEAYSTFSAERCTYITARQKIKKLPAADVAEVRRGRWNGKTNPNWPAHSHLECSNCGWWNTKNASVIKGKVMLSYCPNCGAKMDGGVDND